MDYDSSDEAKPIDGFECKEITARQLEALFKAQLDTLSSSQQVVQRVSTFALKEANANNAAAILSCIKERLLETPVLNRLHLLYVLDAISQLVQKKKRSSSTKIPKRSYLVDWIELLEKDLADFCDAIVPESNPVNAGSMRKFLKTWKTKEIFDPAILDPIDRRISELAKSVANKIPPEKQFSHKEIMKRIEEDRDRHKRLREEGWYRPPPPGSPTEGSSRHRRQRTGSVPPRDEFSESWDKIDGLDVEGDVREWDRMKGDLDRFDAEHYGVV